MIIALAVTAYLFKIFGLVILGSRQFIDRCLGLIPAALLSALVAKDTFSIGQSLVIDARVAGFTVAVIAAWRRAPLIVVVVLSAGATALVRAI